MMQTVVFLFTLFLTTTYAGYAGSYSGNYLGSGGASGGYGYGYGGNVPPGFPQQYFQQIPFDFSGLLSGYLDALMKHHQTLTDKTKAYAYTSVSLYPPFQGKVMARARITYDGLQQLQNTIQQQASQAASAGGTYSSSGGIPYSGYGSGGYGGSGGYSGSGGSDIGVRSGGGQGSSYGGGYGGSYGSGGYGGSFSSASGVPAYGAGASASVGNGGVQQTAFLNPENPANPNVNVRFGGGGGDGGGGKFSSVFTSSSSGSGNVDGKPYGFRRAQTTVNDNGKVSTYTVTD